MIDQAVGARHGRKQYIISLPLFCFDHLGTSNLCHLHLALSPQAYMGTVLSFLLHTAIRLKNLASLSTLRCNFRPRSMFVIPQSLQLERGGKGGGEEIPPPGTRGKRREEGNFILQLSSFKRWMTLAGAERRQDDMSLIRHTWP